MLVFLCYTKKRIHNNRYLSQKQTNMFVHAAARACHGCSARNNSWRAFHRLKGLAGQSLLGRLLPLRCHRGRMLTCRPYQHYYLQSLTVGTDESDSASSLCHPVVGGIEAVVLSILKAQYELSVIRHRSLSNQRILYPLGCLYAGFPSYVPSNVYAPLNFLSSPVQPDTV